MKNIQVKILKNGALKKILKSKYFIVSDCYIFLLIIGWNKYTIEVPEWFITDFGSIPPIFFFFDKSRYISYILHDYLYSLIWKIININWELPYNQKLADQILIAGLKIEEMNHPWRFLVYKWLQIWGRFNYRKENKEISELKKSQNISWKKIQTYSCNARILRIKCISSYIYFSRNYRLSNNWIGLWKHESSRLVLKKKYECNKSLQRIR